MSILIKGMEKPEECYCCPCSTINMNGRWGKCNLLGRDYAGNPHKIYNDCPLIDIPDGFQRECEEKSMSKDYKERMRQEYQELKKRYDNLHKFIVKYEVGTLDFKPDCSLELLKRQAKAMGDYLFALEARAEISKLNLNTEEQEYEKDPN